MQIPDQYGGELEPVEHKQQLQLDYLGCINKNSTQIIRKTVQEDNSETSGEKKKIRLVGLCAPNLSHSNPIIHQLSLGSALPHFHE